MLKETTSISFQQINMATIPNSQELEQRVAIMAAPAESWVIQSPEQELWAAERLGEIEALQNEIHAEFDDAVDKAQDAYEAVRDIRHKLLLPLTKSKDFIRKAIAEYRVAIQQRIEQESAKAMTAASAECEYLEMLGRHEEAAVAMLVPAISQPRLAPGIGTRTDWYAVVTDKKAFIKAVAEGKVSDYAIEPNMPFLNKLASSAKDTLSVPGVQARKRTIAVKKRK